MASSENLSITLHILIVTTQQLRSPQQIVMGLHKYESHESRLGSKIPVIGLYGDSVGPYIIVIYVF